MPGLVQRTTTGAGRLGTAALLVGLAVGPALAQQPFVTSAAEQQKLPGPLSEVGYDQRLGETVPLDLEFRDETGRAVALGDFFGERPVILALVYYECPMLCTMVLNGLTTSLRAIDFDPGNEFEVVVVSFDSREGAVEAANARKTWLERYDRPGSESGWHFLTGDEASIRRLTDSVGFRFVYVEEDDQFAHAAGILALTPEGRLARYFYGIEYSARDIRLGLIEAADEKIGSVVDQVLLYCFHYDPTTGTYSAAAMNLVRLGALVTMLALGIFLLVNWRRDREHQNLTAEM